MHHGWRQRVFVIWNEAINICVLLLCFRFEAVSFRESYPNILPNLALLAGSICLCFRSRLSTICALSIFIPILNGISVTGLLNFQSAISHVFADLMIGFSIFAIWQKIRSPAPHPQKVLTLTRVEVATNLLLTAILCSCIFQSLHAFRMLKEVFWAQAEFGWGDPLYFLSATFIWCQGLTYFKWCYRLGPAIKQCANTALMVWGGSIFIFFLIQYLLLVPNPVAVWAYEGPQYSHGYSSPFDDMHSFGSICATLLTVLLFYWRKESFGKTAIFTVAANALLLLIILSYARAVWVVTIVCFLAVTAIRLPRTVVAVISTAILSAIILINLSDAKQWTRHSYLYRIESLVRFEAPTEKLSSRFFMFQKGMGMIMAKPLFGHGIGSFYLQSVHYADPKDPLANKPDFGHNFILQFAAEVGLLAAGILLVLLGTIVWRGLKLFRSGPPFSFPFSIACGILAYFLTQLTAHAFNIFVSNQLTIWFLAAVILSYRPIFTSRSETIALLGKA